MPEQPWRNVKSDPPQERGTYEFRHSDGSAVQGTLEFIVGFYGEDEVPYPEVTLPDGSTIYLFKFESWR